MIGIISRCGVVGLCLLAALAQAAEPKADPQNAQYAIILEGYFLGQAKDGKPKRLNCYLVRKDGKWTSALGTAINLGKPNWNTAAMLVDSARLALDGEKLTGTLAVTLVPDPWVPKDQKPRVATITIDAALGAPTEAKHSFSLTGKWTSTIAGDENELKDALLQSRGEGDITGHVWPTDPRDIADASYDLAIYNLIPGQTQDNFQRRRALSLGVKNSKVVSARLGQMDMRHNAYDYEIIDTPEDAQVNDDSIRATVSFSADTLDGQRASFTLSFQGQRVSNFVAGEWKGKCTIEDGKERSIEGYFRATVRGGAFESAMAKDTRPWFAEAKDFKPPQAGEHPRLFFRKSDLPELRRRAATAEGQQIIKRLRNLLNGSDGESLPILYNPAKAAYEKNSFKAAPGAYSISSAAGFGFLYQLTGEKKYAELARQCIEKAWEGQRDFDDRYAWVAPGGELRAGPSVGWTAVAYDLCYDGWDEAFRTRVAKAIQDYSDTKGGEWNNPEGITLRKMVLQPKQGPGSNHFGAVAGGCGLAVLAIAGDPGTDKELLAKYAQVLERQVVRHLSAGWGDGGYYKEGWGASQVGTQAGFLCFLQSLKVAAGHDYLNVDRPNASFVTMVPRALMLIGPPAVYPYRSNMGGTYGSADFHRERGGFSHGGQFAEGFGAIADKYKPGLLWVYNHIVDPDPGRREFDTPSLYSHRPMLALINWPTFSNVQEQNPAEAMPRVTRDHLYEYCVFRNRWQDADDIVTTVLINTPEGTRPREVMVWGFGERLSLGEPPRNAPVTHFLTGQDGSGTMTAGNWAIAVDYSGVSGADALIVTVGATPKTDGRVSGRVNRSTVTIGQTTFNVLTLNRTGPHPSAKAEGGKLIVGGQTITFADGKLTLATFGAQR